MRLLLASVLVFASAAMAEPLERLFLTPAERDQLERARERSNSPGQLAVPSVTGYIVRSDGRNTVWLDGVPYSASELQLSQASRVGPQLPVRVRSSLDNSARPKKSGPTKVPDKP